MGTHKKHYTLDDINDFHKALIKILMTGKKTRNEIMDLTGWKWTTIYDRLVIMEILKVVKREKFNNGKPGASVTRWFLIIEQDIIIELLAA